MIFSGLRDYPAQPIFVMNTIWNGFQWTKWINKSIKRSMQTHLREKNIHSEKKKSRFMLHDVKGTSNKRIATANRSVLTNWILNDIMICQFFASTARNVLFCYRVNHPLFECHGDNYCVEWRTKGGVVECEMCLKNKTSFANW